MRFLISLAISMAYGLAYAGSNDTLTCKPAKPMIEEAIKISQSEQGAEIFTLTGGNARAYLNFVNEQDPRTDYSGDAIFGIVRPSIGAAVFGILRDNDALICMSVKLGIGLHTKALSEMFKNKL